MLPLRVPERAARRAPSCAEAGVLGPAAGVIGSLQALEALKLLAGPRGALLDAFLQADLASHASCALRWRAGRTVRTAARVRLDDARSRHPEPRRREVPRDLAAAAIAIPPRRGVSPAEILAAWPGVHALLAHRVAHALPAPASASSRARSPTRRAR